jgi:8-oxo-dGTP pyrophosphatase MutT (NUDIX family)
MHRTEMPNPSNRPRVTVAAIIERDGRFLFVEERDNRGEIVINQPAGHVEGGESLTEAVVREAFEETGWRIFPEHIVGVYLWVHPERAITYLRVAIAGRAVSHEPDAPLDDGILRALWLAPDDLVALAGKHRSPLVMRCVEDYRAGERYPLAALKSLLA